MCFVQFSEGDDDYEHHYVDDEHDYDDNEHDYVDDDHDDADSSDLRGVHLPPV